KTRRSRDASQDGSEGTSQDGSEDAAPYPPRPAPKEGGAGGATPPPSTNGRASPAGPPPPPGRERQKPPRSGAADEHPRQIGDPPSRCPACHPLAASPRGRHVQAV